jgi:uncharacterized protein YgbK (DUF1537 family)
MTLLGCIADDFTGATDLAAALTDAGYRTTVVIGPGVDEVGDADAVVVALKTRTAPVADAVSQSLSAVRSLRRLGAERFYFKYCSTFDSTPQGNIGPVADALLAELGARLGVVVPSFPANGRRVYGSMLFVHGQPLAESPMRDHPLTPMTDSNVVRLLEPQTTSAVAAIPLERVRADASALTAELAELASGDPTLVVLDAIDDGDLARIAQALPPGTLITGGAALAAQLPGGGQRRGGRPHRGSAGAPPDPRRLGIFCDARAGRPRPRDDARRAHRCRSTDRELAARGRSPAQRRHPRVGVVGGTRARLRHCRPRRPLPR